MGKLLTRFDRCSSRTRWAAWLVPLWLVLPMLVAGCQALPPPGVAAANAASPVAPIPPPAATPRFAVDAQASEIRLLVYRSGTLARLGHNHVIVGRVHGEIRAGERAVDSGFRLQIPLDSLSVDPPAARAEEGEAFAATIPDDARQGTRDNMLGKHLLDAASRPLIDIASVSISGPRWNPTVIARTTVHGTTRDLQFPAAVVERGDVLTVVARFQIHQSDFELTPFSVLGGGLQVLDAVDIRLHIVARRTG